MKRQAAKGLNISSIWPPTVVLKFLFNCFVSVNKRKLTKCFYRTTICNSFLSRFYFQFQNKNTTSILYLERKKICVQSLHNEQTQWNKQRKSCFHIKKNICCINWGIRNSHTRRISLTWQLQKLCCYNNVLRQNVQFISACSTDGCTALISISPWVASLWWKTIPLNKEL